MKEELDTNQEHAYKFTQNKKKSNDSKVTTT